MTEKVKFPETLARIAEVAGLPVAIKLAKAYGGSRIYIPERAEPKTVLVRTVGQAAAAKIIAAFGNGYLNVPTGPRSWNQRVVDAVDKLVKRGQSVPQIARALGVSERTVWRCKEKAKALQS